MNAVVDETVTMSQQKWLHAGPSSPSPLVDAISYRYGGEASLVLRETRTTVHTVRERERATPRRLLHHGPRKRCSPAQRLAISRHRVWSGDKHRCCLGRASLVCTGMCTSRCQHRRRRDAPSIRLCVSVDGIALRCTHLHDKLLCVALLHQRPGPLQGKDQINSGCGTTTPSAPRHAISRPAHDRRVSLHMSITSPAAASDAFTISLHTDGHCRIWYANSKIDGTKCCFR